MTSTQPDGGRTRGDLCPGVFRPWPAEDGALVRLRLVGGEISLAQLRKLSRVATSYGDGNVHLTKRANLQLRALPHHGGRLHAGLVDALSGTGLLPSPSHELVRNIMVSPLTGVSAGRADLWPVARALDAALCADPALAALPGRFLFVLDDGRGDLVDRPLDVGIVALDPATAQLRVGREGWGDVVPLDDVPTRLLRAAHAFLEHRGPGPDAAWHVDELARPLPDARHPRDPRTQVHSAAPPYGAVPGTDLQHLEVPDGVLTPGLVGGLAADRLVVTPWHGVLVPVRSRPADHGPSTP